MAERKNVDFYIDLYPGWQDNTYVPSPCTLPPDGGVSLNPLGPGCRRFKITVALPCFGGSAVAESIESVLEDVTPKED